MAVVCQQCGAIGYADLLVYCCLCHKASCHQYCLDTISESDDNIQWLCEDCNLSVSKATRVNDENLDIHPNDDFCLTNKENIISDEKGCVDNSHVARFSHKSKNEVNLHSHDHGMKAWENTERRSIRPLKQTFEACNVPLTHGETSSLPFKKRFNLHDCEIKAQGNIERSPIRPMKHTLGECDGSIDGTITSPTLKYLKSNDCRRSLLIGENDESLDGAAKEYDNSLIDVETNSLPFKYLKPNGRRRKLVLLTYDSDDEVEDSLESDINTLRKIISLHQCFEKNKHDDGIRQDKEDEDKHDDDIRQDKEEDKHDDYIRQDKDEDKHDDDIIKFKTLDKENEDNNLESGKKTSFQSKKVEVSKVKSILQNIDEEMATKSKSEDDLIKSSSRLPFQVHNQDGTRSQYGFDDVLAMPIIWRGWFKICGRAYGPLIAHSSPKIGENAWTAAMSLPQVIQLAMVSRSYAWPRSFKISPPTDDHIALIFFPPDSRVEKMVAQLVQDVIRCDLMLKVALSEAELLVFPSNLLPENYMRFQDKHYLWGVFKRKDSGSNTGETRIGRTYENSATQTIPDSVAKSEEEAQIERDDERMALEGDEPGKSLCPLTHKGGKQSVPNSVIKSQAAQIEKTDKQILLEGDGPQEGLSPLTDTGRDIEMSNNCRIDEELSGCLELFPTQVEDIALKLKMGDRKQSVDLELSLGLPFS